MPRGIATKGGKKNRKHGNNEKYCTHYMAAGLNIRNAKRRVSRHLRKHPTDDKARAALRAFG